MYIKNTENNPAEEADQVGRFFLQEQEKEKTLRKEEEDMIRVEKEKEKRVISRYAQEAKCHWQAHEFEAYEKDERWILYAALILVVIIAYAIYTNSPVMAITFVLIGIVGYLYLEKEPRILDFMITNDGIVAGKEIFEYDRIKSFWIFYEEDGSRVISLHMHSLLTPYMHIPIGEADPVEIREVLLEHVEEIEQDHNIVETLERIFRI